MDADIVIFCPDQLTIDIESGYAFCKEVWLHPVDDNNVNVINRTNNALCVFVKDNGVLDYYIDTCKQIVRQKTSPFSGLEASTLILTALSDIIGFRRLESIGLFSPIVLHDIATGGDAISAAYINQMGGPIWAANLCNSNRNKAVDGVALTDDFILSVLERLIDTKGAAVNRGLQAPGLLSWASRDPENEEVQALLADVSIDQDTVDQAFSACCKELRDDPFPRRSNF